MPLTTIRSAPALDSFVSLEDHQSHTPASFFSAKAVLHQNITGAGVIIARDQIQKLPISDSANAASHGGTAGTTSSTEGQVAVGQGQYFMGDVFVDVFISSENVTLFNNSARTGVSIPYPAITLHAIQRLPDPEDSILAMFGLYMQIELESEPSSEDEGPETIELTIVPPSRSLSLGSVQVLFNAVSTCSNLHPDPVSEDDTDILDEEGRNRFIFEGNVGYEGISGLPGVARGAADGGLPPPFPGSDGWITAENYQDHFDENDNWRRDGEEEEVEGEALGEGAGRVRSRDENGNAASEVNGYGVDEEEEHKRQRTH